MSQRLRYCSLFRDQGMRSGILEVEGVFDWPCAPSKIKRVIARLRKRLVR
jgi:hypothetical protein